MQALNLWLQYMTLLGGINIPAPRTVHWVFAVAQFAFASVSSGSLSTDCLLSGPTNPALQRIFIHLAVPALMFLLLATFQALRQAGLHLDSVMWFQRCVVCVHVMRGALGKFSFRYHELVQKQEVVSMTVNCIVCMSACLAG